MYQNMNDLKVPWITKRVTFAALKDVDTRVIERDLTIKIENVVVKKKFKPTIIKLYTVVGDKVVVPRFYPPRDQVRECYDCPPNVSNAMVPSFISNNQRVVYEHLNQHYARPNGAVLVMRTGEGKTYLARALAKQWGRRVLVVVHNEEIMNTTYDVFRGTGWSVSCLGGGHGAVMNSDQGPTVVIGIIHTLIKMPKTWFDFDFVIYDEITEFVSEKRRVIFTLAGGAPRVMGLTATPWCRGEEKARVFQLHVGPLIMAKDIPGYELTEVPWIINVRAINYRGAEEYTQRLLSSIGYTSAVEMDKQFMTDPARNRMIIDQIRWLWDMDKNIYVFVSICEYASILAAMIDWAPTAILMGKIKTASVSTVTERIIFTTYQFCSKGISIPRMDAIVLAQPRRSDIEQVVGRILRAGGDYTRPRWIIDIIDANTTLRNQFQERRRVYRQCGCKIQKFD